MATTVTAKDLTWLVGAIEQTCVDSDIELDEDDLFADKYYVSQGGTLDAVDDNGQAAAYAETDGEEICVDSDIDPDDDDLFADKYVLGKGGLPEMEVSKDNEYRVIEEVYVDSNGESDDEDLFADKYVLSQGETLRDDDQQDTDAEGNENDASEAGVGNNAAELRGGKKCGFCRRKRPLEEFHRPNKIVGARVRSIEAASFTRCIGCREFVYKTQYKIKTPGVCRYCCEPMPEDGKRVTCTQCGPMISASTKRQF